MKKHLFILLVLLYPLIILSQNLDVEGGIIADSIDVSSGLIKNVADPVSAQDAVTKTYVEQILLDFALATIVDTSKTVQGLLEVGILPATILSEGIDSSYFIGLNHAGGMIFYMQSNGTGLVSTLTDQSEFAKWCEYNGSIGTSAAIGTGQANTTAIIGGCPTAEMAATLCDELVYGGYNDWFLPSKDELNEMYLKIGTGAPAPNTNIGGFTTDSYWSSTEFDYWNAWGQSFFDGFQFNDTKNANRHVRAVRAF